MSILRGMLKTCLCLGTLALLGGAAPVPLPSLALHEAFRLETLAGNPRAAAERYASALAEDGAPGSSAAAALGLGRCLERLGETEQAARAFGWVLSLPDLSARDADGALAGIRRNAPAWLQGTEVAPDRWVLPRAEVKDAVAGAFQILTQLKVEPYREQDGHVGGLMLRSVEPDCLVARRGFKPYDIFRRVNKHPLAASGAAEIIALLGSLKEEPLIEVEIERLGEAKTLRYEILPDRELALRHGPFPRPSKESP